MTCPLRAHHPLELFFDSAIHAILLGVFLGFVFLQGDQGINAATQFVQFAGQRVEVLEYWADDLIERPVVDDGAGDRRLSRLGGATAPIPEQPKNKS